MKLKSKLLGSFVWQIAVLPYFLNPPRTFYDTKNKDDMKLARQYFANMAPLIPHIGRISTIRVREMFV